MSFAFPTEIRIAIGNLIASKQRDSNYHDYLSYDENIISTDSDTSSRDDHIDRLRNIYRAFCSKNNITYDDLKARIVFKEFVSNYINGDR